MPLHDVVYVYVSSDVFIVIPVCIYSGGFRGARGAVAPPPAISGHTLLKLGYAMHTQWYVIHTILLHTSGVFRFGMKCTPLCAHYSMALAPPI